MSTTGGGKPIGTILGHLMDSARFARARNPTAAPHGPQPTLLGLPLLEQADGLYVINATGVRIFSGLAALAGQVARTALEQCRQAAADVQAQVPVDWDATPDLAALGVTRVLLACRLAVARDLEADPARFTRHVRAALDVVQTPAWGGVLFPGLADRGAEPAGPAPADNGATALLIPLHQDATDPAPYFFLLEYDAAGRFLRLTVENGRQSRLNLKHIPHRVVNDSGRRHFRQDIVAMAEQLYLGILREGQNQRGNFSEDPSRLPALFELLAANGLPHVTGASFAWSPDVMERWLLDRGRDGVALLAKILALLEGAAVLQLLAAGHPVAMDDGAQRVYLDLSRKGSMLNVSVGQARPPPDMRAYLARLPALGQAVAQGRPGALERYRILLIHHATAEVLGFVKALDDSGCGALTTLFVRYSGLVADALIEDMLSLPDPRFRFYALQHLDSRQSVAGSYILSRQFSPVDGLDALEQSLRARRLDYLAAMRVAAFHLFIREAVAARREQRQLLLIEDGGYIAPPLNDLCRRGGTLGELLAYCDYPPAPDLPADLPAAEWLAGLLPATFEHTANGYYQLQAVERLHGRLHFPACTIAASRYKNETEAEACAHSILNAVESILAGLGRDLLHRHAVVLGSRGHIGAFLRAAAAGRARWGAVAGLDLKLAGTVPEPGEYSAIDQVPEPAWKPWDLFLGVTGVSVLKRDFFARLLLEGTATALYFASGSTKNVEFADLTDWLNELAGAEQPRIGGFPVRLTTLPIKDPQQLLLQGHAVRIVFDPVPGADPATPPPAKTLYLLGDAMPVNFLYYGVPGEVIDGVFEELFCLVTGTVARCAAGPLPAPGIYAVDINIDKHGQPR